MSEHLDETLHNLVSQVSSIRLKTELLLSKHPEIPALQEILVIADQVQADLKRGMKQLDHAKQG